MTGNSAKKPSPAFAWGKKVELSIPTPPVLRARDGPAAGAGCCQRSEAPRTCLVSGSPLGLGREGKGRENSVTSPRDSPQAQLPRAAPRGVPPQQRCQASLSHPNTFTSEAAEIMPDHQ